jgi:autoinducer 2-degrading protein
MLSLFVTVEVLPEHRDAFIAATALNHLGSVAEPGCRRFDVLTDQSAPNRFYLYEIYSDAAAIAAHRETSHYKQWAAAVAPMMAAPRSALKGEVVFPQPWR